MPTAGYGSKNTGPLNVYCDESGFSGNKMLDDQQPHYVYVAVAGDKARFADFVADLRRRYSIGSDELKCSSLWRRPARHPAIAEICEEFASDAWIFAADKRYSLCGKYFEYVFEPALQAKNTFFYTVGFHKFIAVGLYSLMMSNDLDVQKALARFQDFSMEKVDQFFVTDIRTAGKSNGQQEFADMILDFTRSNAGPGIEEMREFFQGDTPSWMLDLTLTGLHGVLSHLHNDRRVPMRVLCDDAKPLLHDVEMFNKMVGREEVIYDPITGEVPITFNLAEPISLVDSTQHPGVQIADVLAGSVARTLREESPLGAKVLGALGDRFIPNSVMPTWESLDMSQQEARFNSVLLLDLAERSRLGVPLLEGFEDVVQLAEVVASNPHWDG